VPRSRWAREALGGRIRKIRVKNVIRNRLRWESIDSAIPDVKAL